MTHRYKQVNLPSNILKKYNMNIYKIIKLKFIHKNINLKNKVKTKTLMLQYLFSIS